MKSALLMLVLIFSFAGCFQAPEETAAEEARPGDERSFNPITVEQNSDLKLNILNVCAALEEKEHNLESYMGEDLPVTYQEADCSGKLGKPVAMTAAVVREGGQFFFQNAARNFPAAEIETLRTGLMKDICANLIGLRNPLATGVGSQTIVEFNQVETSFCRNDSQNVCLQIMRGRLTADGSKYKVSENTLISFRTARGGRTGFYNYKNVKSFGTCGEGKYITKILTFIN